MVSIKKIVAVAFVSAALLIVPMRSQAIVPVIAAWLLELTGGSILIGDLIAGQTGIISAILWWDCNKFAFSAPCTSKTPIASTHQPKPAITVSLKPDTKRENPDPKKFNDPAAGSGKRDVTPKPIIAASGEGPPPTGQSVPGVPTGFYEVGVLIQSPRDNGVGVAGGDANVRRAQYNASYAAGLVTGIEVVPQKSPALPKAIPFVALQTTCVPKENEQYAECMLPISATEQYLKKFNGQKYISTMSITPCYSNAECHISVAYLYDLATDVTLACDSGYVAAGKDAGGNYQCSLTDASKVKKPTDTTCEVLFDAGTELFMTDKANPACDGITDAAKLTLSSADGSKTVEVGVNAGNGFDIGITKQDGSKTGLDTGVYDPGAGGYPIVHVNITPPPNSDNGLGCGGPGQGLCSVQEDGDNPTWIKSNDTSSANRAADTGMKGKMDSISSNQFDWSFIPSIPTASCKNPSLKSPIGNVTVNMDICKWFARLSFFINAVLGVLCVYGCVNQIQSAIRD